MLDYYIGGVDVGATVEASSDSINISSTSCLRQCIALQIWEKCIEERVRLNVSIMSAHFQNELVIRAEFAGKSITGIVIESWGQI